MEYLIRFIQMHESFRKPETEALAELFGLDIEWVFYSEDYAAIPRLSPFAILRFPSHPDPQAAATLLISRSILSSAIYELWGTTPTGSYPSLHEDVRTRSQHLWPIYKESSFRFTLDSFQGSHSTAKQRDIIETFSYMAFTGTIRMSDPEEKFVVFEEYRLNAPDPHALHLGRFVASSGRKAINTYTLKKRSYIATTSMDAELSLVTANLALAAPGKLAYDPFMGTGSFPLACAHFGAAVFGSDLDGRSVRGTVGKDGTGGKGAGKSGEERSVRGNFVQYGTQGLYLGGFVADVTNTPLRLPLPSTPSLSTSPLNGGQPTIPSTSTPLKQQHFLDAIISDPPYGVREGLKVLGSTRVALHSVVILPTGQPAHLADSYVPPKRPYSFTRMLDDILDLAATTLVDGGRLCMWMPVAGATEDEDVEGSEGRGDERRGDERRGDERRGDERRGDERRGDDTQHSSAAEYAIPSHPALGLVSECTQHFNKWSRRLLTYRRLPDEEVDAAALQEYRVVRREVEAEGLQSGTADSMNEFRKKYFQGFRDPAVPKKFEKLPHTY